MKKRDMEIAKTRKNEKGAAMVMVILISFLLLVACVGVLLESSMNSANVTDAVAEQQAYYAAESGIQSALNVLRGNTTPLVASADTSADFWASNYNPLNLIETRASAQASPTPDRINFRKAVSTSLSNYSNDPSGKPRLSRWLNYNYTSSGSNYPDRVKVGSGNDSAFNLDITDPDKTGDIISFKTTGSIYDPSTSSPGWKTSVTIGTAKIKYTPTTKDNLDVASGLKNTDFGSFSVETGSGTLAEDIRFQIIVDMTAPYTTSNIISGWILKGTISPTTPVVFDFDTPASVVMGSTFSIKNLTETNTKISITGSKVIEGSVTQTEPTRLIVKSTGYGPRGAKKQLETVIQKNFFNGMTAPATLTLVGPPSSTNGNFKFYAGASQNVTYSGDDIASNVLIPSIGTTNDTNLDAVFSNLGGKSRKADIIGYPTNVDPAMPFWLQSARNLNATIEALKTVAKSSGRYYSTGQSPSNYGNSANATGITFVDGNISYSGSGGGILVVTGKLTLHGGFDFNGLIIVTGADGIERSGGGNGLLQGNTVVAPYNPSNISAGFMAPKYDISGGGNSTIRYNSSSLANGMTAVSNFILGVAEK